MEVSDNELLTFMAGKADAELKRRIAEQIKVPGSFVQTWLRKLCDRAGDPFNVDYRRLLEGASMNDGEE